MPFSLAAAKQIQGKKSLKKFYDLFKFKQKRKTENQQTKTSANIKHLNKENKFFVFILTNIQIGIDTLSQTKNKNKIYKGI